MSKNIVGTYLFCLLYSFTSATSAENLLPVARVVVLQGHVTATATDTGTSRTLDRNKSLFKGDTITTGPHSLAQIAFFDGGFMTLNAGSSVRILEFVWNGAEDGTERAYFELLNGSFRAASGNIGHKNSEHYKVHTPHADVGINGTYYGLLLCSAGSCSNSATNLENGLYGGAISGSINTTNTTGTQQHLEDTFFLVDSNVSSPEPVLVPPPIFYGDTTVIGDSAIADNSDYDDTRNYEVNPATSGGGSGTGGSTGGGSQPPVDPVVVDNDTVKANLDTNTPAQNNASLLMSYTISSGAGFTGATDQIVQTASNTDSIALFNNQPVGGYTGTHVVALNNVLSGGASSLSNTGSNGTYGSSWGVWNGDYLLMNADTQLSHQSHLNYIYSDQVTSSTALNSLGGIQTKLAIYTTLDGTLPVSSTGFVDNSLPSIIASADFVSQQLTEYSIYITDLQNLTYFARLANPVNFNNLDQPFTLSDPGNTCSSGSRSCVGFAQLAFVGLQANGAITSYTLYGGGTTSPVSVSGTALLAQPGGTGITQAGNNSAVLYSYSGYSRNGTREPVTGGVSTNAATNSAIYVNASGIPIAATSMSGDPRSMVVITTASTFADAGGVTTVGNENNDVNWGRWQGVSQVTHDERLDYSLPQLFVISSSNVTSASTLSSLGGILGVQTYNTIGGTNYVSANGNVIGNSSISMTADFVGQAITSYALTGDDSLIPFALNLTGNNPVPFNNAGNGFSLASTGSTCINSASCTGMARVQFIGTQAQGAITSFSITDTVGNTGSGAALLAR